MWTTNKIIFVQTFRHMTKNVSAHSVLRLQVTPAVGVCLHVSSEKNFISSFYEPKFRILQISKLLLLRYFQCIMHIFIVMHLKSLGCQGRFVLMNISPLVRIQWVCSYGVFYLNRKDWGVALIKCQELDNIARKLFLKNVNVGNEKYASIERTCRFKIR